MGGGGRGEDGWRMGGGWVQGRTGVWRESRWRVGGGDVERGWREGGEGVLWTLVEGGWRALGWRMGRRV